MSTRGFPDGRGPPPAQQSWAKLYQSAWACLPVMLVLSGLVLLLFGASWWTALVVVLLLACPAAMAVAIYLGFRPFPRPPGPGPQA